MNRDYEDEAGRSRARSRKKPSVRDSKEKSSSEIRRSGAREQSSEDRVTARRQTERRTETKKRTSAQEDDGLKLWDEPVGGRRFEGSGSYKGTRKTYTESPAASRVKARSEKSRRKRRIITMIVAECFALMFIFGYAFVARKASLLQRASDFKAEAVKSDLTIDTLEKMEGYWTIALFGVDSRDSNVEKGTHSDVNIICNINEDTGEIKLVSVFRDSYLNIDDDGSYNKINLAYFRGGPTQAVKALNKNMDLDITDYVTFNWKAVAQGIDLLGGVDIELSKAEFHYINSFITETVKATGLPSRHLEHAGMNHLDGVQAVAYGRLRLMDTDYARTERQRKIIQLAFEKAKKADIGTLNQIIEVVFPNISSSMTAPDFIRMAQKISKYHLGETGGFPFARGDASLGKKGACVIPQTLESNVKELHGFLFGDENYTPTDTVKKISAKISADSGMYNQGKSIGHVSTEGGIITKPKETTAETKKHTETKATEEPAVVEGGIDLDGDGIADIDIDDEEYWDDPDNWPTDADGNPIHPTVRESSSESESESESERESGTASSRPGGGSAGRPDSTSEAHSPSRPEESHTVKPGNGNTTRPGGSNESRPGESSETKPSRPSSPGGTSRPSEVVPSSSSHGGGPGGSGPAGGQTPDGPGGGSSDNGNAVAPPPSSGSSGSPTGNGGSSPAGAAPGGSDIVVPGGGNEGGGPGEVSPQGPS